jgi:hypothetical protein
VNAWWLGLSPAQATITCGEHHHRVRWEAGSLRALDHVDPEGERTLAALGGQRCACVDVLDAWERHQDDLRVLVLASRGRRDQLAPNEELGAVGPQVVQRAPAGVFRGRQRRTGAGFMGITAVGSSSGWTAYGPMRGRPSRRAQAENELIALLGLGGGLQERLVATVAAAWRQRLGHADRALARARPQLRAALHGRVFAALGDWLGTSGLESELRMIGDRDEPKLISGYGVVRAELPFGWLVEVWARDLGTIWGRFCLAATTTDGLSWRLTTVGPDLGPPAVITVQLPDL